MRKRSLSVKCGRDPCINASLKIRKIRVMLSGSQEPWNPKADGNWKNDELACRLIFYPSVLQVK